MSKHRQNRLPIIVLLGAAIWLTGCCDDFATAQCEAHRAGPDRLVVICRVPNSEVSANDTIPMPQ